MKATIAASQMNAFDSCDLVFDFFGRLTELPNGDLVIRDLTDFEAAELTIEHGENVTFDDC